jgi:hypothetical protein
MIYLLHFERPVSGHARHYMGWCRDSLTDLRTRLREHRTGNGHTGSVLTHAAHQQGIEFWLVRTWPGSRAEERRMKRKPRGSAGHARRCPLCSLSPGFAQQLPTVRI